MEKVLAFNVSLSNYVVGGIYMAISEQWVPIIGQAIKWIADRIGQPRKKLNVEISELEKQVKELTEGNQSMREYCDMITQAVLTELKDNKNYSVTAETIVYVGTNYGNVNTAAHIDNSLLLNRQDAAIEANVDGEIDVSKIFDGIDEEIAESRQFRPSERRFLDGNT